MIEMDRRIQSVLDRAHVLLTADVETAARMARISVPHFRALFRKCTGIPYAAWLKTKRLERALQLLQTTGLTIAEICAAIGISDRSHFIRSFKSTFGCTPAALRPTRTRPSASIGFHRRPHRSVTVAQKNFNP